MQSWLLVPFLLTISARAADDAGDPPDYQQLVDQAEADVEADLDEAIIAYRDFIAAHPDSEYSTAARFRLASLLITRAEGDGAVNPDYGPALAELEGVLGAAERGQAGDFTQLSEAWYLLGWCQRESSPDQAALAWAQVVAAAPDSDLGRSCMLHLGQRAMDQGALEQAAQHFEGARSGGPDSSHWLQATYLTAWAQYKLERYDQATTSFVAVLSHDDTGAATLHAEALQYLAFVLLEQSQQAAQPVTALLDATLVQVPTELVASLLEQLAQLLEGSARFQEADDVRAWGQQRDRKKRRRGKKDQD